MSTTGLVSLGNDKVDRYAAVSLVYYPLKNPVASFIQYLWLEAILDPYYTGMNP